jgi:glycosyltransferase involved in cell wall biosynthesis
MTGKQDYIYLSSRDFSESAWTAAQQVAYQLTRYGRVLVVNPSRGPGDILKSGRGSGASSPGLKRVSDNLRIFTPFAPLPFSARCRISEAVNRFFLRKKLRALASAWEFSKFQLWILSPRAAFLAGRLGEEKLIYKCDGDPATFPWLRGRRKKILAEEERLLRKADLVFCTSPTIAERKSAFNPHTFVVRLGVDTELFSRVFSRSTPPPDDIKDIPEPRIGYVGALDGYKVDFNLIEKVAELRPDWHWVLIGREGTSDGTTTADLPRARNIHYLGPRPRREIPRYLKYCQVLAVPYKLNNYTKDLTTLKMFEYMATGRPIVAAPLPNFQAMEPLIKLASSPREFAEALEKGLKDKNPSLSKRRKERAEDNSWRRQVERMLELIARS